MASSDALHEADLHAGNAAMSMAACGNAVPSVMRVYDLKDVRIPCQQAMASDQHLLAQVLGEMGSLNSREANQRWQVCQKMPRF